MEWALILLMLLIVTVALVATHFMDSSNPYPFKKKTQLLTSIERGFLALLEKAVGDDFKIINRVKLNDIIDIKDSVSAKAKRAALLKASSKYIDYVLCDPNTFRIIAAVDLVNHNKGGHKAKQDWFINGALEAAGIPHIRIKVKAGYQVEEIRSGIMYKIGKKERSNPPEPIIKGNIPRRPVAALSSSQIKAHLSAPRFARAS
ncbi:hypothetical protein GCM10008107_12020 [Psychrosphaera saromensis]|jgi:hypothetical protein|uniref:DUF2726 domain-containing protein n=1 Tax=Psychrosphaera saromensis TaxID=716813 RepID=A0A2S7UUW4_9GAMM|nr:DUF2726 domain-containing protein [Psychrosphaera saromensis]PQJ53539.1 hypothetical protein BTO11_07570 [Psychrosphaera saromensis]GHB64464.1 hypothetical protein GCM10008107_12020 [Psychrosphaera saromensis]GLQ15705.1 hypothetical protein GCM10007917_31600 [Psychrosphaera saromensis]